ncbi:anaphase-promoting complex, cyclosome, subunit 4-domain-containing protein, partial [Dimargaris cristalligena]
LAQSIARLVHRCQVDYETNLRQVHDIWRETFKDTLEQHGSAITDPHSELLILLATGTTSPGTSAFLLSTLKTKGLRKWIKTLENGYTAIRDHLALAIKPSCERLLVLFTELWGYTRGVFEQHPLVLDKAGVERCFILVGWLLGRIQELSNFIDIDWAQAQGFADWIGGTITYLTETDAVEDETERHHLPQVDPSQILDYLHHSLFNHGLESAVLDVFKGDGSTETAAFFDRVFHQSAGLDPLAKDPATCSGQILPFLFAQPHLPQVQVHSLCPNSTQIHQGKGIPGMQGTLRYLTEQLTDLFSQPATRIAHSLRPVYHVEIPLPWKTDAAEPAVPSLTVDAFAVTGPSGPATQLYWLSDRRDPRRSSATGPTPSNSAYIIRYQPPPIPGWPDTSTRLTPRLESIALADEATHYTPPPGPFPSVALARVPLISEVNLGDSEARSHRLTWHCVDATFYNQDTVLCLAQGRSTPPSSGAKMAALFQAKITAPHTVYSNWEIRPNPDPSGTIPTYRLPTSCDQWLDQAGPASSENTLPVIRVRQLKRNQLGKIAANGRENREVLCAVSRSGRKATLMEVADIESDDDGDSDEGSE